ncbi:hypothetical protein OHB54_44850 [Streptomyces sp. NBC_01007]|nr:hypothetical protein OHB54_44850 [Streptomyces sp. NBC_01007]
MVEVGTGSGVEKWYGIGTLLAAEAEQAVDGSKPTWQRRWGAAEDHY